MRRPWPTAGGGDCCAMVKKIGFSFGCSLTSSKGLASPLSRVQLKYDGTRLRAGGKVKGKLANGVGSQYSSHYL